jgi:hypothetical protein
MYVGSCLCHAIEIRIDGPIESIIHCHCSLCRKSSGTAFATNGFVDRSSFMIVRGQASLTSFEYKPGKRRFFCSGCGSPIFSSSVDDEARIRIRLGIIDSDIEEHPVSHNFVSSKANWEDLDARLPRYNGFEPGRRRHEPKRVP